MGPSHAANKKKGNVLFSPFSFSASRTVRHDQNQYLLYRSPTCLTGVCISVYDPNIRSKTSNDVRVSVDIVLKKGDTNNCHAMLLFFQCQWVERGCSLTSPSRCVQPDWYLKMFIVLLLGIELMIENMRNAKEGGRAEYRTPSEVVLSPLCVSSFCYFNFFTSYYFVIFVVLISLCGSVTP